MVGINDNILKQLFALILNISISNYIKYRRLTCAGIDLNLKKMKVIDVALKHNYQNSASFSSDVLIVLLVPLGLPIFYHLLY